MGSTTVEQLPSCEAIVQCSVFVQNRIGCLNDLFGALQSEDLHIVAICVLNGVDTLTVRMVVDYIEPARELFKNKGIAFVETEVLAVEIDGADHVRTVMRALVQAELSVLYMYPFLHRPKGRSGLILNLDDKKFAEDILRRNGLTVLTRLDIAR